MENIPLRPCRPAPPSSSASLRWPSRDGHRSLRIYAADAAHGARWQPEYRHRDGMGDGELRRLPVRCDQRLVVLRAVPGWACRSVSASPRPPWRWLWGNADLPWLGNPCGERRRLQRLGAGAPAVGLPELARRSSTSLGGWIYTGVGVGIAATGVLTWLGGAQAAAVLWVELGSLAVVGAVHVMWRLREGNPAAASPAGTPDAPKPHRRRSRAGTWASCVLQRVRLRLHHSRDLPAHHGAAAGVRPARVPGSPGRSSARRRRIRNLRRTVCTAGRARVGDRQR